MLVYQRVTLLTSNFFSQVGRLFSSVRVAERVEAAKDPRKSQTSHLKPKIGTPERWNFQDVFPDAYGDFLRVSRFRAWMWSERLLPRLGVLCPRIWSYSWNSWNLCKWNPTKCWMTQRQPRPRRRSVSLPGMAGWAGLGQATAEATVFGLEEKRATAQMTFCWQNGLIVFFANEEKNLGHVCFSFACMCLHTHKPAHRQTDIRTHTHVHTHRHTRT